MPVVFFAVCSICNTVLASVSDGETIAWFPLDDNFLSSVNTEGNPVTTPTFFSDGGSLDFVPYADSRPIVDSSGNVIRESKYLTVNKSRVLIPLSGFDIGSDVTSVTFEMFIRGDGRGANADIVAWDAVSFLGKCQDLTARNGGYAAGQNTVFHIQDRDDAQGTALFRTEQNDASTYDSTQAWLDGAWHHLAVTVNGATACIFKDYALVKTITRTTSWFGTSQLCIALGGTSTSKLDFDEVRITKGVLAPEEFLCFGAKREVRNGDALLYMPFDGDMESIAGLYDEFGSASTGIPTYDNAVWKSHVVEYGHSDILVRKGYNDGRNLAALNANGAVVTKEIRNPHMTAESFDSATIEFFMRGPSAESDVTTWGTKLSLGRGWDSVSQTTKYGLIIQADDDKNFYFRVDTDKSATTISAPISMFDGKWHHFAITIEPDGSSTDVKFYFDYGSPVERTIAGTGCGLRYGKDFTFGMANNVLWLDEFRVTKGVLPKDKFLLAKNVSGFVLILR